MRGKKFNYEEHHKEINGVLYKKCTLHKEFYPEEDEWMLATSEYFYTNDKNKSDGLHPECIRCSREKARKYKRANRERYLETDKAYNQEHKEEIKIYKKNYRTNNPNKVLFWQRDWLTREENKEKLKKYAETRKNKNHKISRQEWIACKEYFKDGDGDYCCAYCGLKIQNHFKRYKDKLVKQDLHKEHVDHKGSSGLDNCVPSCNKCNSEKHDFKLEDWYNNSNPIFSKKRLNKINKWRYEDFKLYLDK